MHWVSIASAALDEQYARLAGAARRAATEATVTIAPRRSSRCGIAARAMRNAPVTLTRKTLLEGLRFEVEQRALSSDAGVEDERVEAAEAVDRRRNDALGVGGDTRVGDDRKAVDLARYGFDRARPSPRDGNRISVGGEPAGDCGADARATAGDEGHAGHGRRSLTISWSSTV